MSRILLALCLLGAGCQGVVGPFQRVCDPRRPDNVCLPIPEQEQRGRELLALPEKRPEVAPRTYAEEPAYRAAEQR